MARVARWKMCLHEDLLGLPSGLVEFDHLEIADYLGGMLSVWFWSEDSGEYEILK